MMDQLEMLSAREQLMEDIDSIISGFFNDTYEGQYPEECEDLTRILCDAVCKNFPANWCLSRTFRGLMSQTGRPPDQLARWHTK